MLITLLNFTLAGFAVGIGWWAAKLIFIGIMMKITKKPMTLATDEDN